MLVRLLAFSAIVVLFSTGCGAKRSTVSGSVTYKGKNLTHGIVVLHGVDGVPVNGSIDESGKYEAKDVPIGETIVTVLQVTKDYKSPAEIRKEYETAGKNPSPELFSPPKSLIPVKYNIADTSGLKVNITSGKTNFDIGLVD